MKMGYFCNFAKMETGDVDERKWVKDREDETEWGGSGGGELMASEVCVTQT